MAQHEHELADELARLPPEVIGFAAAAMVTFLGIAVIGPKVLSARRATAAKVDALQRRARAARRDADRAAARAQAAMREAAARARSTGRQARDAGYQARDAAMDAAGDAAAQAGRRVRRLGGGSIRPRWS